MAVKEQLTPDEVEMAVLSQIPKLSATDLEAACEAVRDRSIFMGKRDREICNGTTGYFGP